jgi:S-methylmethionine-dependent homocysteine/selenocysteine methylase
MHITQNTAKNKLLQRLSTTGGLFIDGGMTKLKDSPEYTTLWSAAALLNEEGRNAVKQAHINFINTGAELIITNSYACTTEILHKAGIANRQEELLGHACRLAHEAVAESGKTCLVAGSMPPLSVEDATQVRSECESSEYEKLASILEKNGVDLFVCEDISSIAEASAAVNASQSKPVFVAITLDNPNMKRRHAGRTSAPQNLGNVLRSGDSLVELVTKLEHRVGGFLINCCSEEAALGLHQLFGHTQKPCGVYAKHFEPTPKGWKLDQAANGTKLLKDGSDINQLSNHKNAKLSANNEVDACVAEGNHRTKRICRYCGLEGVSLDFESTLFAADLATSALARPWQITSS